MFENLTGGLLYVECNRRSVTGANENQLSGPAYD
jgi:hypothetical protein